MIRARITYANVMSTVAVFVALGGTSYAVAKLPRNSVGSEQVRDRSLKAKDLAPGAMPAGPQGPQGAEGARGPANAYVRAVPHGVALPRAKNQATTVAELNDIPPGAYLVSFAAQAAWFGSGGLIAYCTLKADGAQLGSSSAVVGAHSGSVRAVPLTDELSWSSKKPFRLSLECANDQDVPADQPQVGVNAPRITALQVETLRAQ